MECKEILEIFLGGTFHQDIESEESALKEYCELGNEALNEVIDAINEFLILSSSKEEKNKFIEKNAFIATADKDYLYLSASAMLPPNPAEVASGIVVFYGARKKTFYF